MLRQIALLLGVCCGIAFGAVFDPYSRRYGIFKNTMDPLLDVAANGSCDWTLGMKALPIKTSPVMTATQQTIYNAWVNQVDTTIIKNVAITTKKAKWIKIAASIQQFSRAQAQLYGLVQFLNVTTWGPVDSVVQISREWIYQSTLELTVATSAKGNCKLFDKLLAACSGDSAKYAALSAFIESDLKAIVIDKTKSQVEVTKAVYQAFQTKFFIGAQASWIWTFYSYDLEGYFAFGQFSDVAVTYERQVSVQTALAGPPSSCPFIVALNACLSNSTFNTVQKGFIKQLINYFTAEWSTTVTVEARIIKISMKFSEAIDTSYAYHKVLSIIWIPGFGSWWDLIMYSCQMNMIPSDCGCPIPVFTTTPLPTTTTEMPTTTTEMPTTTTTEEPTTTTTEEPTTTTTEEPTTTTTEMSTTTTEEATTSTSTEMPTTSTTTEEPTSTDASCDNSPTTEPCPYIDGNAGIQLGCGVTLNNTAVSPVGKCGNSVYYAGDTEEIFVDEQFAGTFDMMSCPDLCACTSSACYESTPDGYIGLYPHCESADKCYFAAVVFIGTLTNTEDPTDIQTADAQIDLVDTFNFFPVTNSYYKKLTKFGCNGCPVDA